ncbi:TIGR02680 family protein [Paradesulfitobacterium ferrireducens]|uniref:TIGR02680 family protein n=1 Tax=Paradesulfitobacterium ferrireducens TaxID=2816476 RepID=UPI001A8C0523|nr:TIGR02680 family protein [Paradesulfitobacterium ferrireducens]
MELERWQLNRAGLFNFWYFDDEELPCAEGKLLLRGANGSGKSVTMQSLITVLLDGKKSSDRLDPFGSRARRMEDYLLGEKEVVEQDERTGYLYLEYARPGRGQYLTTGIGLRAKRQSSLDFWGFVILDNRRIGRDFLLYKTERDSEGETVKIPLSRRELENRLGEGGQVVRTQQEYMALVNKHVFGFRDLETFEDLMKLLIQLRSPKLSKDFRPTVVYEILTESLPALTDEELRPLSDTIENMDQIKSQLDQAVREEQALQRLLKVYDQYNQRVFWEKGEGLVQAHKRRQQGLSRVAEAEKALAAGNEELNASKRELEELKREQDVLDKEKEELQDHDVFRAERERSLLLQEQQALRAEREKKERAVSAKETQERETRAHIVQEEEKERQGRKEVEERLDEMDFLAEEAGFQSHEVATDEFKGQIEQNFSFNLWRKEARDHEEYLDKALSMFREERQAQERYRLAELDLGEAAKALDQAQFESKKWADVLEEERANWVNQVFAWNQDNKELKLEQEELQLLMQRIRLCPDSYSWDVLREPVRAAQDRLRQQVLVGIADLKHLITRQEEKIEAVKAELQAWQGQKDPEPPRHAQTEEARRALAAAGVPFLPFYAAVEFHEHVPKELRASLEAALKEAGILDALIVGSAEANIESDRILEPNPQFMTHTLAEYLYPTPVAGVEIAAEDIDNVLRTVLVGEHAHTAHRMRAEHDSTSGGTVITEDGGYRIGLIQGQAPREQESIYIGKEARRQYRLKEIARLEKELALFRSERGDLVRAQEQFEQKLELIAEEAARYPSERELKTAHQELDSSRRQIQVLEQDVAKKNLKLKADLEQWQDVKQRLRELTRTSILAFSEEAYATGVLRFKGYREHLGQLEVLWQKIISARSRLELQRSRLEELTQEVDELKGELEVLRGREATLQAKLEKVEARLHELGAEEIRRRVRQVVERLQRLPAEIEGKITESEAKRNAQEQRMREFKRLRREQNLSQALEKRWLEVFAAERKLHQGFYSAFETDEQQGEAEAVPGESVSDERLAFYLKEAQAVVAAGGKGTAGERESLQERVSDAFFREQGNLVEYRPALQTMFESEQEAKGALEAEGEPGADEVYADLYDLYRGRWQELRIKARRTYLLLEYEGKKVNPYYARSQMEKNIALQEQLLNEKDRELYEEIIMHSVGRIIRGRIQRAEHWVEEMNHLMAQRDTSSGLNFSVRWRPRTAEYEEEMDTEDLVQLLKADPRLLKESDMARIVGHFRSKIERAKSVLAEKGYGESFHQIIKEMLDYRQWFAFTLYYQKSGERRKELTNHVFYTFSGGEKAMAMYIPLFSAAYSRYSDARPEAPRLISLDEAFAGVDENNIRDMFDLMERLGFNYIINSQALWGDYDTVAKLSICELVRPKNASWVTVIRYFWDGKVRRLVEERDMSEEAAEVYGAAAGR